jgi:hypothetical protein
MVSPVLVVLFSWAKVLSHAGEERSSMKIYPKWTPEEEKLLREGRGRGLNYRQLSKLLPRHSPDAIGEKLRRMWPPVIYNNPHTWTSEADDKLIEGLRQRRVLKKLAEELGRKPHALVKRMRFLKECGKLERSVRICNVERKPKTKPPKVKKVKPQKPKETPPRPKKPARSPHPKITELSKILAQLCSDAPASMPESVLVQTAFEVVRGDITLETLNLETPTEDVYIFDIPQEEFVVEETPATQWWVCRKCEAEWPTQDERDAHEIEAACR